MEKMFKAEFKYTDETIEFDNLLKWGNQYDEEGISYYAVTEIGDIETYDMGITLIHSDLHEIDIDTLKINSIV